MSATPELLILGCGHSEAMTNHNNNAAVLSPQGTLLIDCGHTIKHALRDAGMTLGDVDAIFITHVHGDHVFGLERVAYESRFKYHKRVRLIFHESLREELWDQTLKGSLGRNGDGEACLEDYFDVEMLHGEHFRCHGIDYRLVPVQHTPGKPTFGLMINDATFYSSDTVAIPETLAELEFELGFHDVTLAPENPVHASLTSLLERYDAATRRKLYLMSYEDEWPAFQAQVEAEFKGFARQGMRVAV